MKIYQVEIANYCNLKCPYCPHPLQTRDRGFMKFTTFKKVVNLAKLCNQNMIYLHNFGEPLLHPDICGFLEYAKSQDVDCSFYTNGILLDSSKLRDLYTAGLKHISISNHKADADLFVKSELRKANVPIVIDEVYNPILKHNWAGQVAAENCNYICKRDDNPCIFERENAFVILWNGDISTCCLDCNGNSVHTNIDILLSGKYMFEKFALCNQCDLMRGEEDL